MALTPTDQTHALQIQAGTEGRRKGHKFELELANKINTIQTIPLRGDQLNYLFRGSEAETLIRKCLHFIGWDNCDSVEAIALGAIATAEEGKKWLRIQGVEVRACKNDILITLSKGDETKSIGVSVKQCDNKNPTNAQLYFTTATAFVNLLRSNNIGVSDTALNALKQFCGDNGYRPLDDATYVNRKVDPRRFFWEEIEPKGKKELEDILIKDQDSITRLLFQKAYLNDPFIPELLLHKTRKKEEGMKQEYALYSIDELVMLSGKSSRFNTRLYRVAKGSYVDPIGIQHEAPRFGIVQMQRGGQAQHPTQLQFNLKAGYFYHI